MKGRALAVGLLAAVAFAAGVSPLLAGDPKAGGQLAQRWCVSCHAVGEIAPGTTQEGPPSFNAVAQSGRSRDELRAFLSHPHGMPDLSLTRAEIDDLVSYIETLRQGERGGATHLP